jgi:hypothetical protein
LKLEASGALVLDDILCGEPPDVAASRADRELVAMTGAAILPIAHSRLQWSETDAAGGHPLMGTWKEGLEPPPNRSG